MLHKDIVELAMASKHTEESIDFLSLQNNGKQRTAAINIPWF